MKDDMQEQESEIHIESTGEDNLDESLLENEEESSQAKIKKLQAKLKACETEKTAHLNDLQRAKADFLNARKRLDEEKQREKDRLIIKHVEKLLPLYDSFFMATSNTEAWNAIDQEWRKGVESIYSQLEKLLRSYGVKPIDALGQEFDPELHEAMVEQPVTDENEVNTVVTVIQTGFVREVDGKTELVRPARVAVGVSKN